MKKKGAEKIDSFEKLGSLIVDEIQDFREEVDARLLDIESEVRGGFLDVNIKLDKVDTRLAGLEYKVFGFRSLPSISKKPV